MAKQAARTELSSPDFNDETSSDEQDKSLPKLTKKKDSIKSYVTNILQRQGKDDDPSISVESTQIRIDSTSATHRNYENISAFRQYHSNIEATTRINAQRPPQESSLSSDHDDLETERTSAGPSGNLDESMDEFNLDPNPIIEQRESAERIYKQKVYLRQLQPPTPQPIEIEVQEVLLKSAPLKSPVHVRVGQREPRTPSPIVIKSTPPQPPPPQSDQPIIYNKYVPPPKQPPQQIIIHRHPNFPPKPRPIVIEQWLPYKPAPKRIIKHSLPPEALQTPAAPHNLIVSYAKPRALIEVELVRLPAVKIDPFTYEQMSGGGHQTLTQHPTFQHEQDYLSGERLARAAQPYNQINWRI